MKKLTLLFCLLSLFSFSYAQEKYTIMATGGNAEYSTDGISWLKLVVGQKLDGFNEIKVDDAYVCLLTPTNSYVEIIDDGRYKLSNFYWERKTEKLRDKLASYIFDQLAEEKKENTVKKEMTGVGGVERSVDFGEAGGLLFGLYPNNGIVIDDEIEFKWTEDIVNSYLFTLSDEAGNIVYTKELKDTKLTIDLDDLELKPDVCYFWSVESPITHSYRWCVVVADDEERRRIEAEFEEVEESLDEDSPVDNMIMADFFVTRNIVNRAVKHYLKAIELSENSFVYVQLFERYLDLK